LQFYYGLVEFFDGVFLMREFGFQLNQTAIG
jgi:hypothetical protein